MRAAKEIQLDVVQVQQFLSDISATRAQDGLDDGFRNAQKSADEFARDVATAASVATALRQPEITRLLNETKDAFDPYYQTGKRMAQSYIDGGPVNGNQMMPEFDKTSEILQQKMDQLLSIAETAVGETAQRLRSTIGATEDQG